MSPIENLILQSQARLKPYKPRTFLSGSADLRNPDSVGKIFEQLLQRPIHDASALEQWLWDRSEFESALDEAGSILYIRMTCQTDHLEYAQAHEDFVNKVLPVARDYGDRLNQLYSQLQAKYPIDPFRYEVYHRDLQADLELFRSENIPLQTQLQLLAQEYQAICGSWTVTFDGREQTLTELSKYQQDPDRVVREQAWRQVAERRAVDATKLEELFDKMRRLRQELAKNSGCRDFVEYQFRAYHRFDYTPQDCKPYHDTIRELVVPLWKDILLRRQQEMGLASLRPWDLEVDPLGRPALQPFAQSEELTRKVAQIFKELRPDLGAQFFQLAAQGLLDLDNRKGKAPGGYQNTLNESRLPFIFMNAIGLDDDVRTLLHEGGHAFHALACRHDPLLPYRHGPMEFCEVASMSMELLGGEHLEAFYNSVDKERSRVAHLEGVAYILVWVAIVDKFQHWIYENPEHSISERRAAWRRIHQEFGGGILDWSGLEMFQEILWHRQLHIFEVPFYYIEYGIAQLGALQVWLNSRKNKFLTLQKLMKALALGGSRPLPELFQVAGLKFGFSGDTIQPLADIIRLELGLPQTEK